jgi:hypothetical protein
MPTIPTTVTTSPATHVAAAAIIVPVLDRQTRR